MKPSTREWVKKGRERFQGRQPASSPPQGRCAGRGEFFCQQCVEKYLKARLIEAGIAFPRTHDLLQLLNLCLPVEPLWSPYAKIVDAMSDYAVDFRYPGHSATLAEARRSFKACKAVRREVRMSLGLPV